MSRAKRMRIRQIRRNRRIAFTVIVITLVVLFVMLFDRLYVTAEKPSAYKYYTDVRVQNNDTLWTIAERYMTEEYDSIEDYVHELREINNLGCVVEYGQQIMVPYYSEEEK